MRITYRQLLKYLVQMHPDQLDCDITVQLPDGEFFPADFRILAENSPLDNNHPVFYVLNDDENRATEAMVDAHVRAIGNENGFGPVG